MWGKTKGGVYPVMVDIESSVSSRGNNYHGNLFLVNRSKYLEEYNRYTMT